MPTTITSQPSTQAASQSYPPALMKQAQGLEGLFLNTLTKEMFSSIQTDGPFGGGFGEQTWRGMQAEQMANAIAQNGGIGLAENITRNLLDAQEAAQSQSTNNITGNDSP
ncbi:MAG TPA: rod-binding protein [Devosiaceae bacterium]|nr:rod-binding protein [Devosiaceae bacterium]